MAIMTAAVATAGAVVGSAVQVRSQAEAAIEAESRAQQRVAYGQFLSAVDESITATQLFVIKVAQGKARIPAEDSVDVPAELYEPGLKARAAGIQIALFGSTEASDLVGEVYTTMDAWNGALLERNRPGLTQQQITEADDALRDKFAALDAAREKMLARMRNDVRSDS